MESPWERHPVRDLAPTTVPVGPTRPHRVPEERGEHDAETDDEELHDEDGGAGEDEEWLHDDDEHDAETGGQTKTEEWSGTT